MTRSGLLRGFARAWTGVVVTLIVIGAVGLLWTRGWPGFAEVFSPWNLKNWLLIAAMMLPAVAAERLSK